MKRILTSAAIAVAFLLAGVVAPSPAAAAAGDCDTGGDAGNDFTVATVVSLPVYCSGSTVGLNDVDWYSFSVSAGRTIKLWAWGDSTLAPLDACLYDPLGSPVDCGSAASPNYKEIEHTAGTTGRWRLRISQGLLGASYSFSGDIQTDCDSGTDAGNSYSTALATSLTVYCVGHVGSGTDVADWYKFSASGGTTLWVDLDGYSNLDLDVCLYSPTNSVTPVACGLTPSADESFSYTVPATAGGTWRVKVYGAAAGDSSYLLWI